MNQISQPMLRELYINKKLSSKAISLEFNCSESKVNYWIQKYGIKKRSISEAVYLKQNPNGDPFKQQRIITLSDAFIYGLGLGLFWGEGNKKNPTSVRLGNSDPDLIKVFLYFLEERLHINRSRLKFGLQIFSDMDSQKVERYWRKHLNLNRDQFYKTVITISGKVGTYKEKSSYGILTLYFHNRKLRDLLVQEIDNLRLMDYSSFVLEKGQKPM